MRVEILIYAYLAICVAMIVFNMVCVFVFQRRDNRLTKSSIDFTRLIREQMDRGKISDEHRDFLTRKLIRVGNLMAFDEAMEVIYREEPDRAEAYLQQLQQVFVFLTMEYHRRDPMQMAYFPYILKKYKILRGTGLKPVIDVLKDMVSRESLYCRENALEALYSIGDVESVVEALKILDKNPGYHHNKLITDGLLTFQGDSNALDRALWEQYYKFSNRIRVALLDYFRFHSGAYCENMLRLMSDRSQDNEIRYSCIRYFGKYPYLPALPLLTEFAVNPSPHWEYQAITAQTLASYPSEKTERLLKDLLSSPNWYVRYNAAESLEQLGLDYDDLIDIFEGTDRFASEILRYRHEHRKLVKKEGVTV